MLEYGVRERTPWESKGCIVARYMLRSDAERFVKQERKLQRKRNDAAAGRLTYTIVRFRKATR
jgi:hypothetical protein